jgi:hexosaminidase
MKKEGIKSEHELQSYFIKRLETILKQKGKKLIGWDEILEGGLAPNAVVESWRGTKGGIAAARQGHDVIMAPTDHVYFDYLQGSESEEPIAIGGYNPLEKVYAYDPTPAVLSPRQQKHILGVEACIWTEFMPTANKVEYMILPRMLALSEVGWSEPAHKNYVNFSTVRLPRQLARIDTSSVLYRVPEVIGLQQDTLEGGRFSFVLKPPVLGAKIYYTLDGYKPDATTFLYNKPLTVLVPEGQQRVLKVIAITPSGKRSPVTTALLTHATK